MPKRWTFSESEIRYDPAGAVARLLQEKVPLRSPERRWLLVSGITLSEWYCNRLSDLWVERGSLTSAHSMFGPGLNHFFDALFSLNDQLVPDHKWRHFCAERLSRLPKDYSNRMQNILTTREISLGDLKRRRRTFMTMWQEVLEQVEAEVGQRFEEFKNTV